METRSIAQKASLIVAPVLANLGYELVECEYLMEEGRFILRLYVDKEGGVTLEDCELISRAVGDLIDVEEVVPGRYNLEVSSPGIARPLRNRRDFEKYVGNTVKIKTTEQIDGRGNFKGELLGMDGDDILVSVDNTEYRVPYEKLLKAKIEPQEELFVKGKKKLN